MPKPKIKFNLKMLLLLVGILSLALSCVRYFAFPSPLVIQIHPAAARRVPENGAFSANGKSIPTNSLAECVADYATATLGRFRHGRVIIVLPPDRASGNCADALYLLFEAIDEAGITDSRAVRNDLDDGSKQSG